MKSAIQIIEEVRDEMCENYCKFNGKFDEDEEYDEIPENSHCDECPLNRL